MTIRITLTLQSLGAIPEHQLGTVSQAEIDQYMEDGDDWSVAKQVAHFGEGRARQMIINEFKSWLDDLGCGTDVTMIDFEGGH